VYSSVRDPEHTAIVNAISTLISAVQVVMIWTALRLLRRGGDAGAAQLIASTDIAAGAART
jgi:hypothetical protein